MGIDLNKRLENVGPGRGPGPWPGPAPSAPALKEQVVVLQFDLEQSVDVPEVVRLLASEGARLGRPEQIGANVFSQAQAQAQTEPRDGALAHAVIPLEELGDGGCFLFGCGHGRCTILEGSIAIHDALTLLVGKLVHGGVAVGVLDIRLTARIMRGKVAWRVDLARLEAAAAAAGAGMEFDADDTDPWESVEDEDDGEGEEGEVESMMLAGALAFAADNAAAARATGENRRRREGSARRGAEARPITIRTFRLQGDLAGICGLVSETGLVQVGGPHDAEVLEGAFREVVYPQLVAARPG